MIGNVETALRNLRTRRMLQIDLTFNVKIHEQNRLKQCDCMQKRLPKISSERLKDPLNYVLSQLLIRTSDS